MFQNFINEHFNQQSQILNIYYNKRYRDAPNNQIYAIAYKSDMFYDWRDTFIDAFNQQVQCSRHKCPRIVLHGEPNTGKVSFVKFLFGKTNLNAKF